MRTWWTETGWPWLKGNWWVLLLLPLILLVGIGVWASRLLGRRTVVVDLTAASDQRAVEEAETRARLLAEERDRLVEEKAEIEARYRSLQEHFEQRLLDEIDGLRNDPQRLRELMLAVGRGERR